AFEEVVRRQHAPQRRAVGGEAPAVLLGVDLLAGLAAQAVLLIGQAQYDRLVALQGGVAIQGGAGVGRLALSPAALDGLGPVPGPTGDCPARPGRGERRRHGWPLRVNTFWRKRCNTLGWMPSSAWISRCVWPSRSICKARRLAGASSRSSRSQRSSAMA